MSGVSPADPQSLAGVREAAHEGRAKPQLKAGSALNTPRIKALDGLRGTGAICVLLMHAFPVAIFWNWIWMEMFFVLSGFLITTILLRTDLTRRGALRNFMARRALRIWPVYYLGLLAAFLMWEVFGWWHSISWEPIWWKCLFYLQFTEGYSAFDLAHTLDYAPWFRHTWSLAVEEQYYLFWPLLMLLLRGHRLALGAVCLGFLATCFWMRSEGHSLNILFTRGDGFALGSLLAMLEDARPRFSEWARRNLVMLYAVALAVGLALILPYIVEGYATDAVRTYADIVSYGNWTVNVTAAACVFFGLIGLMRNGLLRPVSAMLSWRPLTWLGEVSYAIYMFQELIFAGLRQFLHAERLFGVVGVELVGIAIAIAIGPLSRRFLEQPINDLKRHFPVLTPAGASQDVVSDPRPAAPAAQRPSAPPIWEHPAQRA